VIDANALRDDLRLLRLYWGARVRRLISASTADLVNYFAAAEQALEDDQETPGNLFAWIVLGKHWHSIGIKAEDRAVNRLKVLVGRKRV
jgi:hypothetical protein